MTSVKPTLVIFAHSRDCNHVTYCVDNHEHEIELASNGYVPRGLSIGGGDDIHLSIDIETGTIIGWDAEAVKAKLAEYVQTLKGDEDE